MPAKCRQLLLLLLCFLPVLTERSAFATEDQAPKKEFDPHLGIDADGRIPKVPLLPSLSNPERWRYVPEGRIHPGNIFDRFLTSTFFAPLFFFEGDVGAGGGVSFTDIDFRQQRRREFAGIFLSYTTEGEQRYAMTWRRWIHHYNRPEGGIFQEERSYVQSKLGYQRALTRRFYGLGSRSDESNQSDYSHEVAFAGIGIQTSIPEAGDNWVLRLGSRFEAHGLSRGAVSGEVDTKTLYNNLFDEADSLDQLWVNAGLSYDTRDSQHLPYSGGAIGFDFDGVPLQSKLDAGGLLKFTSNYQLPVPALFYEAGDADSEEHPPIDSIAIGAQIRSTIGDLPFWALPTLGGSHTLRGFTPGRFTDKNAWHSSIEYRYWMMPRGVRITDKFQIERLGMALFYDVGSVASRLGKLADAQVQHSAGISFRATIERQALFRIDLGFSEEGSNLTVAFGLSF